MYYWTIKFQALKPKHHKEFREGIADKVGVHEDVVDDFITFYYAKVRKGLSNLSYPNVSLFGLGTFNLRKKKLDKAIMKNKSYLGNLVKNTYDGYDKHISVKEKITILETAKNQLEEQAEERKNFKRNK